MVLVAGIALIVYGAVFIWRNVNGFVELGLTPEHVGGTPAEIRAFTRASTTTSVTFRLPSPALSSRSASRSCRLPGTECGTTPAGQP
jgi:hypothetical protein